MYANAHLPKIKRVLRWLPAALLAVGLAACGGGSGGTTTPVATGANVKAVSVGAITGFGSVHLNGKKFETTSASIKVDGNAAMQSDLKVGDVIEVSGHHDDSTGQDVADSIEYQPNVRGPVSAIDATAGTLVVLGQSVVVSADTFFGDGIVPASLAGLAVNDIVEVSGMVAANGDIQATRIERKAAGSPFEVTGVAASTNGTAKTLMINALQVDFSAATLGGFPSTGPKDGDRVEARGTTLGTAGQLLATRLDLLPAVQSGEDQEDGEIEGLVTRFASAADFDVAGHPVTTSASTTFEGGTSSDLALNVRVEVEGKFNAAGVLEAATVRIHLQSASATRLLGRVDAVDTTAATVTVLGITVSATAMTSFEDETSAQVTTFKLSDIHTGDWLDIRGSESPAGSNKVVATRIERIGPQSSVGIAGVVKTAVQPNFTILSVNIVTTPTTMFSDSMMAPMTVATFFTGLVGQGVAVRGTWDGTMLTAQQASLHHGED